MRSEPGTILAVLLACLLGFTKVAAMPADSLGPPADAVQLRSFDEAALDAYRADPAYDYERIAARPPTPWERFKEWLFRRIGDLLGSGVGRFVSRNIFYLIVAAGLLLAIWVLRKGGLQRVFGGDLPARAGSPRWRRTSGSWTWRPNSARPRTPATCGVPSACTTCWSSVAW